jgi:hypothetical protein
LQKKLFINLDLSKGKNQMAFLPTNAAQVQQFAVALYGIKVGSATMAAVQADIANVGGLNKALNSYYAASFGSSTTAAVAASVAANLGLTGTAATDAAAYITAVLNGTAASARGEAIQGVLSLFSTLTANATFGAAATAWNAKVESAIAYTGASDASVAAGSVAEGTQFVLTDKVDVLTGTSGNDTFIGDATTIVSSDQVSGGAGTDTLKIYDLAAATDVPAVSGVEIIELVNADAPANLDLTGITELTTLVLDNTTTGDDYLINSAVVATVKNMVAGEAVTLTSRATDTAADLTVSGLDAANAGTVTVNFDGALITTANIVSSGSTVNNLTLTSTGAETTLNVSGAAGLVLVNTATGITTFNAATATGDVTFDGSAATGANITFTSGSGNDTITADLDTNITVNTGAGNDVVTLANPSAANLTSTVNAADSINGGDGTDTLSLTNAGAVALAGDAAADRAVITNFEQLRVSDDLNAASFAISAFGMNYLQIGADTTTAAATVSGFTSGATVEYRAAADSTGANGQVNITMTGATNAGTPDDTLNIKLNSNLVDQANAAAAFEFRAGVSGINKISVTTADRVNTDAATSRNDGYILTLANDNSVTLLTASGSSELSFTSTASTASLVTVNGSALTGDLIVDLSTNGLTQGVTVNGGAGANTITGTGFGDVITGGARADTFTLGAGVDTVTGAAGADTFVIVAADYTAATAAALAAAADSVTDFASGSDIIDWDATISFVTNATAVAGTASINAEGFASFDAADDTLAERITAVDAAIVAGGAAADGQAAIFTFGADTYVFISEGTDGVGAGDALIKLVGVTGLSDTTVNADNNLVIA